MNETYSDYLLERFLNVNWTDADRKKFLDVPVDQLPYLPLDIKIPSDDLKKIIQAINSINTEEFFYYCKAKHFPTNMEKLVFYGSDNYKNFWNLTNEIYDFDSFEKKYKLEELSWQIEIPELKNFVEQLPIKTLYSVESRNAKPQGKDYVHFDREKMFTGMHNRLYIPLYWPEGARLSFAGIGNMWIQPGRVYVLNGNNIPHGSYNNTNERRLSLIVSANTKTKEYSKLIEQSVKKFKNYM